MFLKLNIYNHQYNSAMGKYKLYYESHNIADAEPELIDEFDTLDEVYEYEMKSLATNSEAATELGYEEYPMLEDFRTESTRITGPGGSAYRGAPFVIFRKPTESDFELKNEYCLWIAMTDETTSYVRTDYIETNDC